MARATDPEAADKKASWTFLSNHAHVLVCIARDPDCRLRDVAEKVGITERAVFKIVSELEEAKVIRKTREGRRNHYAINATARLRHPVEADRTVGGLLEMLLDAEQTRRLGLRRRADRRGRRAGAA